MSNWPGEPLATHRTSIPCPVERMASYPHNGWSVPYVVQVSSSMQRVALMLCEQFANAARLVSGSLHVQQPISKVRHKSSCALGSTATVHHGMTPGIRLRPGGGIIDI